MISRPLSVLVVFISVATHLTAANWPGWRGQADGSGISPETNLPIEWDAKKNIRWKIALPERGNSTPVVWQDRIFLTQNLQEQNQRTLMCLNRVDGKVRWQRSVAWADQERSHRTNPYCSSSPVTDGERVIAWFGSAGVVAYDMEGKPLWSRDLGVQSHEWGYGSSPLLDGDRVILFFGPGKQEFLTALDKRTGKTIWKTEPPALQKRKRTDGFRGNEDRGIVGTFSSPILVDSGGRRELIMSYPQLLVGYDPANGKELWRCDGMNELIYTSPIAANGVAVGMGGYHGTTIAVKLGGTGDVTETHRLWRAERTKNRLGSGVIRGDHVYILNTDGIAECLELKTGRRVWQERVPSVGPKGQSWSSMVAAGDYLYVPNQSGDVAVLKASPAFQVVSVNGIGNELTNASLAISEGELFLRTHEHLWCISDLNARTASLK